jgi:hypothetical protein
VTSRFCARCGAERTDAAFRFCARCGAEFDAVGAAEPGTVPPPAAAPVAPQYVAPAYAPPPQPAAAYFPPGYARQPDSVAPRMIAAVVLLVYAIVEIWGFAGGDGDRVAAPIPRHLSSFKYYPWEMKLEVVAGVALLLVLVAAIVVPRGGRIACGVLLLATGVAYLAAPLIFYGREHVLGAWVQHSGSNFWTYLAVAASAVVGAVAYLATSGSSRR